MGSFELMAKLGLNAQPFERGLASVRSQVKDLASEKWEGFLKGFAVAGAVEGFRELAQRMVELRRNSEKFGVSTDFLQAFEKQAQKLGGTAEEAHAAIEKLSVKIGEARTMGGEAADVFRRLGVSLYLENGQSKTTEEVIRDIANRYQSASDAATKAAIAFEFFGRTGKDIREILANGAKGIDDFVAKTSKVSTASIDALADAFLELKRATTTGWLAETAGVLFRIATGFFSLTGSAVGAGFEAITQKNISVLDRLKLFKDTIDSRVHDLIYGEEKSGPERGTKAEDEALIKLKNQKQLAEEAKKYKTEQDSVYETQEKIAKLQREEEINGMADNAVQRAAKRLENAKIELHLAEEKLSALDSEKSKAEQMLRIEEARNAVAKAEREKRRADEDKIAKIKAAELQEEEAAIDRLIRKRAAEIRAGDAKQQLEEAKGNRLKYTLEELMSGNEFGVKDEGVASDITKAHRLREILGVDMGHATGELGRAHMSGDLSLAGALQDEADKIIRGLGSLRDEERYPFKSLEQASKDAAKALKDLVEREGGGGLKVVPVMGK